MDIPKQEKRVPLVGDKYELGEEIGRGAFGQVFRATDIKTGEIVAIKQISLSGMSPDRLEDMRTEIDLLKKLKHKNIVKYIDSFKTKSHLHIVLEYMEDGALSKLKDKWGVLKEFMISSFITQVLQGLEYLHAQGVVHRDIKGANILLGNKEVKLADFGVATEGDSTSPSPETDPVGTPYWMAPEVIEMTGSTAPSDIWSVGCVVVELFTGSPPYFDLQPMSALYRIVQDEEVPLPEGASKEMRAFLKLCFEKDPNDRPTAGELLTDPWLVGARKTLKMSWNKAAGLASKGLKPKEAHRTMASVMQRMIEHSNAAGMDGSPAEGDSAGAAGMAASASAATGSGVDHHHGKEGSPAAMLPPLAPAYRDDTAKRGTLPMMPVDEGQEESGSTSHVREATLGLPPVPGSAEHTPEPERSPSPAALHATPLLTSHLPGRRSMAVTLARSPEARLQLVLGDLVPRDRTGATVDVEAASGTASMTMPMGTATAAIAGAYPAASGLMAAPSSAMTVGVSNVYIPGAVMESPAGSHAMPSPGGSHVSGVTGAPVSVALAYGVPAPGSTAVSEFDGGDMDEARQDLEDLRKHMVQLHNVQHQGTGATMCAACAAIQVMIKDKPETKQWFLAKAGVVSIMEMLQQEDADLCGAALDLLLAVVTDDAPVLESLCLVGVVPIATRLTAKDAPGGRDTRNRAARFVELLCATSGYTVQMFVACGGLAVLVEMLDSDYLADDYLVAVALESIWSVMQVHGPTPLNHYCRLLSKANLASHLLRCMRLMITAARAGATGGTVGGGPGGTIGHGGTSGGDAKPPEPDRKKVERIREHLVSCCDLLLVLSHSDSVVKASTGGNENIQAILSLMEDVSQPMLLKMLQTARNLSSDPQAMRQMQNAGAVPKLVAFLRKGASNSRVKLTPQLHLPLLEALYNLCRQSKQRQSEAAAAKIAPVLKKMVPTRGAKMTPAPSEFLSSMSLDSQASSAVDARTAEANRAICIRMLTMLAHCDNPTRDQLWACNAFDIFMDLLCEQPQKQLLDGQKQALDPQKLALDALAAWLVENTPRVEPKMSIKRNIGIIVAMFRDAPNKGLERLIKPFKDITTCSPKLCTQFSADSDLPHIMLTKLKDADAFLTFNILDIIQVMYNNHPRPKEFILRFKLPSHLDAVRLKHGVAVKVVNKCEKLQEDIQVNVVM